jgi:hypothetical protein
MFDDGFPMIMEREVSLPEGVPPVAVSFGLYPMQDEAKTAEAGHPVFVDREFVKIAVPGDKHSLLFQPATAKHKERFPRAWEAYQKRATTPLEGTPLEQWPLISRGLALTLRAIHIHTVEALAAIHDGNLQSIGFNAREWREKAKAYIAQAKDTAVAQKLATDNQKQADIIADLQRQLVDLANRVEGGKKGKAA